MVPRLHRLEFAKTLTVFDLRKSGPSKLNFWRDRRTHLLEFRQDRPSPNESYEVSEAWIVYLFCLMELLLVANGKEKMRTWVYWELETHRFLVHFYLCLCPSFLWLVLSLIGYLLSRILCIYDKGCCCVQTQ